MGIREIFTCRLTGYLVPPGGQLGGTKRFSNYVLCRKAKRHFGEFPLYQLGPHAQLLRTYRRHPCSHQSHHGMWNLQTHHQGVCRRKTISKFFSLLSLKRPQSDGMQRLDSLHCDLFVARKCWLILNKRRSYILVSFSLGVCPFFFPLNKVQPFK